MDDGDVICTGLITKPFRSCHKYTSVIEDAISKNNNKSLITSPTRLLTVHLQLSHFCTVLHHNKYCTMCFSDTISQHLNVIKNQTLHCKSY